MNISIWNDAFWLPKNVTWNDFTRLEEEGVRIPKVLDLLYVYPLAGLLYLARLFFEHTIARPIGRTIGIRDGRSSTESPTLKSSDKIHRQQRSVRISPLAKFSESTWRFAFYLGIFLYGVIILKNVRISFLLLH